VIAPGTGLGEAFLTWDGRRYCAQPSEGGHASFAPADELQMGLLRYLLPRFGHVSYERVCSGIGIPNLYAYLRDSGIAEEPEWLAEQLNVAADDTPVIVNAALNPERPCAICAQTLELFVSILGAEAGNLALKVYATGGVYVAGGIPPRILGALERAIFVDSFRQKGRFAAFLSRVPVHVVTRPSVALLGAAYHGFEAFGYV
jgi:glucokinase